MVDSNVTATYEVLCKLYQEKYDVLSCQQERSKLKDTRDTTQTQEDSIKRWKDVLHDDMDNNKVRDLCKHANSE